VFGVLFKVNVEAPHRFVVCNYACCMIRLMTVPVLKIVKCILACFVDRCLWWRSDIIEILPNMECLNHLFVTKSSCFSSYFCFYWFCTKLSDNYFRLTIIISPIVFAMG